MRGDAHASLRLADTALVGSIGNVVQQHQAASRSGGDADGLAAQAAQTASAQSAMTGNRLFNQLAMHLVAPADAGSEAGDAGRNRSFWARGFGSHGRIEGDAGVAGLSHTIGGIALGADTRLADDRVTLGVSRAAADMSTRSSEGAGFSGDVRA
ncbi:autotransporter outer membrane beta-barrel domain-containing protein, partial [Staphylococcus aureus]|nr:autotransporter outer membrane beta-barrel domain-containing protein [Staphylococcus aureus]